MTEKTKNPDTPTQTTENPPQDTPPKENPYAGMAEKLEGALAHSVPATADDFRVLDPAYTLGRQMLALGDLFCEALDKFHDRKGKPHNDAYRFMLPMALKIQQNCLSTARTMSAIDYMEHLRDLPFRSHKTRRTPLPPPPHSGKRKEFSDDEL